jgi:hypothetical protein
MGHTMLGIVLQRQNRHDEARTELFYAVTLDPEDEDALEAWSEVQEKVGPLPPSQQAALRADVARWAADAGVK